VGPTPLVPRLVQRLARLGQQVLLLGPARRRLPQAHQAVQLGGRQPGPAHGRQHLGLVAGRQPYQRPRRRHRPQPQAQVGAGLVGQPLDQGQAPAHPALVLAQQVGDRRLRQAVVADQGVDDPGLFPVTQPLADAVEAVDGGLGGALVGVEQAGVETRQAEDTGRRQALEAVDDLRPLLVAADDHRGQLPPAAQRAGQVGLGLRVGQAVAAVVLAQFAQRARPDAVAPALASLHVALPDPP